MRHPGADLPPAHFLDGLANLLLHLAENEVTRAAIPGDIGGGTTNLKHGDNSESNTSRLDSQTQRPV